MKKLMRNIKEEKDPTKLYFLLDELKRNITKNYGRDSFVLFLNQALIDIAYILGFINVYIFAVSQHTSEIISANIPIIKSIIDFSPKFQAPFWTWLAIVCLIPPIVTGIMKAITNIFVRKATVVQADAATKTATNVLHKLKEVRKVCVVDDRMTPAVILGSLAIHIALAVLFLVYKNELYINVFGFLLSVVFLSVALMFINVFNVYFSGAVPAFDQYINKLIIEFEAYAKEEEQTRVAEEQARIAAEQARIAAEQAEKAAELYAQATQGEETNLKLLEEAADMGDPSACKEYGKMLYLETDSNLYTRSEKERKCMEAAIYLEKAKDQDIEAEFLWIACRVTYERHDVDGWKEILNRIRNIKKSGKISGDHAGSLDLMIQLLVETVDNTEAKQQAAQLNPSRSYCRYYNAGICNHQSTAYYIHKCNNPENQTCTHALLNNGFAGK